MEFKFEDIQKTRQKVLRYPKTKSVSISEEQFEFISKYKINPSVVFRLALEEVKEKFKDKLIDHETS